MPLESRKLVTMVILRSQTPCRLTAGKIVLLSMETFGVVRNQYEIYNNIKFIFNIIIYHVILSLLHAFDKIVKTSISYFTVMVSMR